MTHKAILLPSVLAASITATLMLALGSFAGAAPDNSYRPLLDALNSSKQQALSKAEEAQLLQEWRDECDQLRLGEPPNPTIELLSAAAKPVSSGWAAVSRRCRA